MTISAKAVRVLETAREEVTRRKFFVIVDLSSLLQRARLSVHGKRVIRLCCSLLPSTHFSITFLALKKTNGVLDT